MRICQISSFVGNVGDSISHLGLECILNEIFPLGYSIQEIEIRRSYLNYRRSDALKFDKYFALWLNREFDLLIIGGGCFLEPFSETASGFRFEHSKDFFDELIVPVWYSSIGLQTADSAALPPGFVDHFLRTGNKLFLRNDGSFEFFSSQFGADDRVHEVLDSGFFSNFGRRCGSDSYAFAVVNVGYDQVDRLGELQFGQMLDSLSLLVLDLVDTLGMRCKFVCHTPYDVHIVSQLLLRLPDWVVRTSVSAYCYSNSKDFASDVIGLYRDSQLNVCGRFHSNVLGLMNGEAYCDISCIPRVDALTRKLETNTCVRNSHIDLSSVGFYGGRVRQCDTEKLRIAREETLAIYKKAANELIEDL